METVIDSSFVCAPDTGTFLIVHTIIVDVDLEKGAPAKEKIRAALERI